MHRVQTNGRAKESKRAAESYIAGLFIWILCGKTRRAKSKHIVYSLAGWLVRVYLLSNASVSRFYAQNRIYTKIPAIDWTFNAVRRLFVRSALLKVKQRIASRCIYGGKYSVAYDSSTTTNLTLTQTIEHRSCAFSLSKYRSINVNNIFVGLKRHSEKRSEHTHRNSIVLNYTVATVCYLFHHYYSTFVLDEKVSKTLVEFLVKI